MADVLYRKYRSKSFTELVGQETTVTVLKEAIKQNKVAHAYLFSGPRGTGKTSAARIFSKAINCEKFLEVGDVCNECIYCKAINNGQTQDVLEMDAASNRKVDDIRELKNNIDYLPTLLKKRIIIIDEAHMLTNEAFNALLKTLEEPPEHIVFIFATTEAHKMPVTILSRVQRFDFKLGTKASIVTKLANIAKFEGFSIEEEALDLVFKKSGGSYRDSESLLGKILNSTPDSKVSLEEVQGILGMVSESELDQYLELLIQGRIVQFIEQVTVQIDSGLDLSYLVEQLLEKCRDILLKTFTSDKTRYLKVMKIVGALIKAKRDGKEFTDKQLVLEIYLSELAVDNGSQNDAKPDPVKPNPVSPILAAEIPEQIAPAVAETPKNVSVVASSNFNHVNFTDTLFEIHGRVGAFVGGCKSQLDGGTLTIFVDGPWKQKQLTENILTLREATTRMGVAVDDILIVIDNSIPVEQTSVVAEIVANIENVPNKEEIIEDNSALVEEFI